MKSVLLIINNHLKFENRSFHGETNPKEPTYPRIILVNECYTKARSMPNVVNIGEKFRPLPCEHTQIYPFFYIDT